MKILNHYCFLENLVSYYFGTWLSKNIVISKLFETHGLLTIPASNNVVRLSPPLIINNKDVDTAIQIIRNALKEI